jgi:hypothetical protein|tara:strand:+ start:1987 stop:2172 length:186 start_codon:yes stop_codon:yes gene_type:complete
MEIKVSLGQWMFGMSGLMAQAPDETTFLLPSLMHMHAFQILKQTSFPERNFTVKLEIDCHD